VTDRRGESARQRGSCLTSTVKKEWNLEVGDERPWLTQVFLGHRVLVGRWCERFPRHGTPPALFSPPQLSSVFKVCDCTERIGAGSNLRSEPLAHAFQLACLTWKDYLPSAKLCLSSCPIPAGRTAARYRIYCLPCGYSASCRGASSLPPSCWHTPSPHRDSATRGIWKRPARSTPGMALPPSGAPNSLVLRVTSALSAPWQGLS
jgi:hypothetical protein